MNKITLTYVIIYKLMNIKNTPITPGPKEYIFIIKNNSSEPLTQAAILDAIRGYLPWINPAQVTFRNDPSLLNRIQALEAASTAEPLPETAERRTPVEKPPVHEGGAHPAPDAPAIKVKEGLHEPKTFSPTPKESASIVKAGPSSDTPIQNPPSTARKDMPQSVKSGAQTERRASIFTTFRPSLPQMAVHVPPRQGNIEILFSSVAPALHEEKGIASTKTAPPPVSHVSGVSDVPETRSLRVTAFPQELQQEADLEGREEIDSETEQAVEPEAPEMTQEKEGAASPLSEQETADSNPSYPSPQSNASEPETEPVRGDGLPPKIFVFDFSSTPNLSSLPVSSSPPPEEPVVSFLAPAMTTTSSPLPAMPTVSGTPPASVSEEPLGLPTPKTGPIPLPANSTSHSPLAGTAPQAKQTLFPRLPATNPFVLFSKETPIAKKKRKKQDDEEKEEERDELDN